MDQDVLNEIAEKNPSIDRTALELSRRAAEQLKAVGIELGGYRIGTSPMPRGVFDQKVW